MCSKGLGTVAEGEYCAIQVNKAIYTGHMVQLYSLRYSGAMKHTANRGYNKKVAGKWKGLALIPLLQMGMGNNLICFKSVSGHSPVPTRTHAQMLLGPNIQTIETKNRLIRFTPDLMYNTNISENNVPNENCWYPSIYQ